MLNNLVLNARDSMSEGGIIEVKPENIMVEAGGAIPRQAGSALPEGKYVKIPVKDHGPGIPQEYLGRIFDPYFTTKEGETGLGLATAFSIIKKHNGYIDVESQVRRGTTFDIYLPATEERIVTEEKETPEIFTGKGKILLMDDEKDIRDVMAGLLVYLGYEVDLAQEGNEAINLYKKAIESGCPFLMPLSWI